MAGVADDGGGAAALGAQVQPASLARHTVYIYMYRETIQPAICKGPSLSCQASLGGTLFTGE